MHEDLVAGVDGGQTVETEFAHRVVMADVVVLALEDDDVDRFWPSDAVANISLRRQGRGELRDQRREAEGRRQALASSPSAWMPSV